MSEDNFAIDIEPGEMTAETADSPEMDAAFEEGLTSDLPEQQENTQKIDIDGHELSMDELRDYAQKGLNFGKLESKVQQIDQKFGALADMAEEQGMDLDSFLNQLQYNAEEAQVYSLMNEYDISEDDARRFLDDQGFFDSRKARETAAEQEQMNDEMFSDFVDYWQQQHGRPFDPEKDSIPAEVWQEVENGTPLRYAFVEHEINRLKQEIQNIRNPQSKRSHQNNDYESAFLKGFDSVI